jgi:hypothetical protein
MFRSTKVVRKLGEPGITDSSVDVKGKTRGYPSVLDFYKAAGYSGKRGDLTVKGLSNASSMKLGDDRVSLKSTLQHDSMRMVDLKVQALKLEGRAAPPVEKHQYSSAEYERMYRQARQSIGDGTLAVSSSRRALLS